MMYDYGFFFGRLLIWLIPILLIIAAVVVLIVWAVSRQNKRVDQTSPAGHSLQAPAESKALQILDERLAAGDISEDEYIRKKALLRQ